VACPLKGLFAGALFALAVGCGSSSSSSPPPGGDAGGGLDAGVPVGSDGGSSEDAGPIPVDGSYTIGDAAVPASRFITSVVSFSPTECTGFGQSSMPAVVEGPPVGGGADQGSTDVVSLGSGGSIVVSFAPNAIVDGPGPDFIVFENPFEIGGSTTNIYAEPGEVSVSDDGTTWTSFPCTPTYANASDGTGTEPPYGSCAGWHVVFSTPTSGISPFDTTTAGGDAFDLADIGVTHARYVRIVDHTAESCPETGADKPTTNGFDLDAIAIVNAEEP
jgi:hypothetical protein